MAVEQKFVSYLLDEIDTEMESPQPSKERIVGALAQLRGIADEVFGETQTASRRGRKGGANA